MGYEQLHANIGFERGTLYWGLSNGSVTYYSSGGATGPGYVRFTETLDQPMVPYIYQTVRTWRGENTPYYRAKINARTPSSAHTGVVQTKLWTRYLTEKAPNPSCAQFYTSPIQNPNSPSESGTYVLVSGTPWTIVGSSWTAVDSPFEESPLPASVGYQLQVRAYGFAYNSSTNTRAPIHFDNIRGEVIP